MFVDQTQFVHFCSDLAHGIFAGREQCEDFLDVVKGLGFRLNRSKSWLVEVAKRSFARQLPTPQFLANSTVKILTEVIDIIF
ncbi:MAG TPA: hypothetical protein ENI11_04625 [Actinobacteria bacterium]|nr:hypothetical protein [Actinomycetota bacterium]